jgi:hypothetical protein
MGIQRVIQFPDQVQVHGGTRKQGRTPNYHLQFVALRDLTPGPSIFLKMLLAYLLRSR